MKTRTQQNVLFILGLLTGLMALGTAIRGLTVTDGQLKPYLAWAASFAIDTLLVFIMLSVFHSSTKTGMNIAKPQMRAGAFLGCLGLLGTIALLVLNTPYDAFLFSSVFAFVIGFGVYLAYAIRTDIGRK